MSIALPPQDLTCANPAAVAALMLGDSSSDTCPSVVTLTPRVGHESAHLLTKLWEWSTPLWQFGVLGGVPHSTENDSDPLSALTAAAALIHETNQPSSQQSTPIRPETDVNNMMLELTHDRLSPMTHLTLSTAMEIVANQWNLPIIRSAHRSTKSPKPAATCSIPMPIGANGQMILWLRNTLHDPLNAVQIALGQIIQHIKANHSMRHSHAALEGTLKPAINTYATEIESVMEQLHQMARDTYAPLKPAEVILDFHLIHAGKAFVSAHHHLNAMHSKTAYPQCESVLAAPVVLISARQSALRVNP